MRGHTSNKWSVLPDGSLSGVKKHSGPLGVVTIPLLRGLTGVPGSGMKS